MKFPKHNYWILLLSGMTLIACQQETKEEEKSQDWNTLIRLYLISI